MTPTWSFKEKYMQMFWSLYNNQKIIYTICFVLSIVFALSMIGYRFVVQQELSNKSGQLTSTSMYSLDSLQNDDTIKDSFPLRKQISDILWYETQIDENIKNTQLQRQKLSVPFDNLFNMLYTPTINVWRDPFSLKINTDLIGKKYIENNPYWDITLIQQWTNFFKDVWVVDNYNTVNDIRIWKIEPSKIAWYFSIPIKVDFETPDKRSFLLLVNKISMTAYIQNLSLINEFIYYIWETIKEEKQNILQQDILFSWNLITTIDNHDDRAIWYLLYNWIVKWGENKIITTDIITKAIRKTAGCTTEWQQECMYIFRGKMRALPYLAYWVGRDDVDAVEWLKFFFKNIPPILSIESFSFEEKDNKKTKTWYKWSISIRIYGKDILPDEINAISKELWAMCFLSKSDLNIWTAKSRLEKNISDLDKWNLNVKRSTTLNQILSFIMKVEKEYPTLPNQKKVIRLFELYRTLKENSLCDIIKNQEEGIKPKKEWWKITEQIIDFNDMTIDKIDNIQIQTGTITQKDIQIPTTGIQDTVIIESLITGDTNSSKDQQITNKIDTIQK
jgi:hypothetical protein